MPYKNTLKNENLPNVPISSRYQALNSPKGAAPRIEHFTSHLPCLTFHLPCTNRVTRLCAPRLTYPGHKPVTLSHVPLTLTTPYLTLHLNRVTHLCDRKSHPVLTFYLPGPRYLLTNDLPCAGTWSFSYHLLSHLTYPVLVI
jgi:hypothetical protein